MAECDLMLRQSDKFFWHGYVDFYNTFLPANIKGHIIEFGVFNGHSIRWLMEKYPESEITGVDILETRQEWPVCNRVHYACLDQGHDGAIASFFEDMDAPDLIIDDGSHIPSHQSRCLKYGFRKLKSGGIYILEDIHTSFPSHDLFKKEFGAKHRFLRRNQRRGGIRRVQTALSILLAFDQIKRNGNKALTAAHLDRLAVAGPFSRDDVVFMFENIASIHVYKRATLPSACFSCGAEIFDYLEFKCVCGEELLSLADSMSVLICKA